MTIRRRDAIAGALFGTGSLLFLPIFGCRNGCASRAPSGQRALTFDPHEWATVDAATARIIPGTPEDPGAQQAQVVRFIDRQLAEPHFVIFKAEFEAGVAALDLVAAAGFGRRFTELKADEQDTALQRIESGHGSAPGFAAAHFFQVLLTLTLEGFLSDPIYGGNDNGVGWQVIGYAPGLPRPGSS